MKPITLTSCSFAMSRKSPFIAYTKGSVHFTETLEDATRHPRITHIVGTANGDVFNPQGDLVGNAKGFLNDWREFSQTCEANKRLDFIRGFKSRCPEYFNDVPIPESKHVYGEGGKPTPNPFLVLSQT